MAKLIIFFFSIISSINCLGQQRTKTVYNNDNQEFIIKTMDDNAKTLMDGSGAHSISIGIVKNGKIYTKHYGEIDKGKGDKATNETLFEIASVTKVFTGTLMAIAVVEGKINLDDDIRTYLIGSYPNLEYKRTPIRIRDLQSYKIGIYRDFPDVSRYLAVQNDSVPFKVKKLEETYSKKQFFDDLASVKMDTLPGAVYKHTKLGPELSAVILENIYKKSYRQLLQERIFDKLGMNSTKLYLGQNEGIANGYNEKIY